MNKLNLKIPQNEKENKKTQVDEVSADRSMMKAGDLALRGRVAAILAAFCFYLLNYLHLFVFSLVNSILFSALFAS